MAINSVSDSLMNTMNPASAAGSSASSVSGVQDRFMTLLVTQLKNQDPLNPMDNAQVTSQMAQLSTVTGIEKMNTTLESLMNSFQSGQSLQATGMIGHSVLAGGNGINLADGAATFGVDLASAADSVQVKIRDAAGTLVRTLDVGALKDGVNALEWDGKDEKGTAAPAGKYSFEISATKGTIPVTATSLAVGAVSSVSTGAGGVKLNVDGVGAINMADVRQIL